MYDALIDDVVESFKKDLIHSQNDSNMAKILKSRKV